VYRGFCRAPATLRAVVAAHKLKCAAQIVGATGVAGVVAAIERAGKAGDHARCRELFVLVFDNGYFPSSVPSASRIGPATRRPTALKILGCRRGTFATLPKRDVYIVEGPVLPRPEDLDIVLALNNRIYESISLTAWIADNPPTLLTAISACPKACLPVFRGRKGQCVDAGGIAQPPKGVALAHEGQRCGSSRPVSYSARGTNM
jgi:hypothetical protein